MLQLLDSDGSFFARERIAQQFLLLDDTIWLPLLLTGFCLGAHSILVSHRVAGPLHQFRRLLGAVGEGDLSVRAVLRDKDYLRKEEAALNGMIEKLGWRIGEAEEEADELRTRLRWLRTAIATRSTGEVLDQLRTLDQNADSLRATLGQFTLPRESAEASGPVLISRAG